MLAVVQTRRPPGALQSERKSRRHVKLHEQLLLKSLFHEEFVLRLYALESHRGQTVVVTNCRDSNPTQPHGA